MSVELQNRRLQYTRWFTRVIGWTSIAVALATWVGLRFHGDLVRILLPEGARMKPNAALCLFLLGLALALGSRSRVAQVSTALVVVVSGLSLGQTLPGQMAGEAALAFLLLATGSLSRDVEWRGIRMREVTALLAFLLAFTRLMAYGYGLESQRWLTGFSDMTLHASAMLVLVSLAFLALDLEKGWMKIALSDGPGGAMIRRVWPPAMLLALTSYWAQLFGGREGWYSPELGLVLFSTFSVAGLSALVWLSANSVEVSEKARRAEHRKVKDAEKTMRHYGAIVESSEDAIMSKTLNSIVVSWNRGAERIFGYTAEEVIGRPITLLIPPGHLDEEDRILEHVRRAEPMSTFETVRLGKDGKPIDISITVEPIRDAEGRVLGASSIARDITARKRAEHRMEDALQEITDLKAALDQHAIVAITDPRGDITSVNDKFCAISKYSREELIGQNHRIINSGHHSKEFFEDLWSTISHGKVWKGEIRNRAKDGSFYWVDTTIVPFVNHKGIPRQYVAIRADITDRKLAVEALQKRSEDLERSNAALEEFAYVASHDLQEPLRGVSGCIQLLRTRYAGRLDETADEFIRHSVVNIERMQQLILGLLEYSRVDRKGQPFTPVDCEEALRGALQNLETAISESGAHVAFEKLPVIDADAGQLAQLFQNLIGNAIKFRGANPPSIGISARELTEGKWAFAVRDNGIGLEPRHAERIFGVFQRLHARNRYPGTGIGLAICKRIVERHGGRIWVESVPGEGATFHLTLAGRHEEN